MSVAQPHYDRSRLTPGIVHIGLGNFHRAHMAVYLDDLFARGEGHDWAILGAGVRPADARRSEEHTSEPPVTNAHLVCRLLLEKKNKQINNTHVYHKNTLATITPLHHSTYTA